MSRINEVMESREEQWKVAEQIAIEAKVLRRCEFHDEVYDQSVGDETSAYKLGNHKLSSGQLGDVFSSSREMTDKIKAVIKAAGMECGGCASERAD